MEETEPYLVYRIYVPRQDSVSRWWTGYAFSASKPSVGWVTKATLTSSLNRLYHHLSQKNPNWHEVPVEIRTEEVSVKPRPATINQVDGAQRITIALYNRLGADVHSGVADIFLRKFFARGDWKEFTHIAYVRSADQIIFPKDRKPLAYWTFEDGREAIVAVKGEHLLSVVALCVTSIVAELPLKEYVTLADQK